MKTITLATGTTHVPFNEVAHLIAFAIHPEIDDVGDNSISYHFALNGLETELKNAAKFGQLPVKNKLTLGAHELPIGDALNHVLVTVDDLRAFVADKYIKVVVEATEPQAAPATDTATPAPGVAVGASLAPPLKQRTQERRILELITGLGYAPSNLPARTLGKGGAKAEIKKMAMLEPKLFSKKTFDTAWQRLRDDGDIAGG